MSTDSTAAASPSPRKKDWVLTKDAFEGLLRALDADPERAGHVYEHLRVALVTFFACRGGRWPEELADETINRVARRLAEGASIHTANPSGYFYGVARNVLREHWDAPGRSQAPLDDVPESLVAIDTARADAEHDERAADERRLACLEACLETLASADRSIITDYYRGETRIKIQNRQGLASRLGIGATALRLRALRLREKLERCVERCLGTQQPS